MRSENETSGAHDGAVSAIVSASLTPMTMPAIRGPSGLPTPPSITAANTTPRVAQREAHAGNRRQHRADTGQHEGDRLAVDAEGAGDGSVLGGRAHRPAEIGELER